LSVCLGLTFYVLFCFSLDYLVLVLLTFLVLDFVSSVLRQETGWEEHLPKDVSCRVGRKTLTQSILHSEPQKRGSLFLTITLANLNRFLPRDAMLARY